MICCGIAVKRMGMLGESVRKINCEGGESDANW
jgi:hypothetical protein